MEVKFTKEQQSVIDERNSNLLVSAAAGSGKTAVLVERIIQMISSGLDVDHLLVVTFTKAAAAQMREKITLAIQKKLLDAINAVGQAGGYVYIMQTGSALYISTTLSTDVTAQVKAKLGLK